MTTQGRARSGYSAWRLIAEELRREIGATTKFRLEVRQRFDELIREGQIDKVLHRAKLRNYRLSKGMNQYNRRRAKNRGKRTGLPARTSEQKLSQMRQMLADGLSRVEIGRRFGVSSMTIARCLERRTE